jgi:hypothetical protein
MENNMEMAMAKVKAQMFENLLRDKLDRYSGLTYDEVEMLCKLFGIERKTEE